MFIHSAIVNCGSQSADRVGRQQKITQGGAITIRNYNEMGGLLTESYGVNHFLAGRTITSGYDNYLRYPQGPPVANTRVPAWQSVSVAAAGETNFNGNVFVPQTPEAFTPDADGNLLTDGRWN